MLSRQLGDGWRPPEHESELVSVCIKMTVFPAFTPSRALPCRYTHTDKAQMVATLVSMRFKVGLCSILRMTFLHQWRWSHKELGAHKELFSGPCLTFRQQKRRYVSVWGIIHHSGVMIVGLDCLGVHVGVPALKWTNSFAVRKVDSS